MKLKFTVDGNVHYGWARLQVANDVTSFTIKDYAYESTPDQAINAGDIGSSVESLFAKNVNIFSHENKVIIQALNSINAKAEIFNTLGQKVFETVIENNRTSISLKQSGMYVVKLTEGNNTKTQKVYIK